MGESSQFANRQFSSAAAHVQPPLLQGRPFQDEADQSEAASILVSRPFGGSPGGDDSDSPSTHRADSGAFSSVSPLQRSPLAFSFSTVAIQRQSKNDKTSLQRQTHPSQPTLQAKLTIGQPGDVYEQEADQVAARVMGMSKPEDAGTPGRRGGGGAMVQSLAEDEEAVQQKTLVSAITPLVQRQENSEAELQTKPLQRQEEEEELQAKRIQRQEEEEELQAKPLQRQEEEEEEEEELQAKPLQRQEEEELQAKPLQRQEEEEKLQAKPLQRQAEEEEELQAKPLQRQEEEEELQAKPLQRQEKEDDELHAKAIQAKGNAPAVPEGFENRLASHQGGGQPLPDDTRDFMESRFGADFGDVRVHQAAEESQAIGAQAFTHGKDIYFNAGKYDPVSDSGKLLLAHELTHTIQQTGGKMRRKPNKLQLKAASTFQNAASTSERQPAPTSPAKPQSETPSGESPAAQISSPGASAADQQISPNSPRADAWTTARQAAEETIEQIENLVTSDDHAETDTADNATGLAAAPGSEGATAEEGGTASAAAGGVAEKEEEVAAAGSGPEASEGTAPGETPAGEVEVAANLAPKSPQDDPGFQAVVDKTKKAAKQTKSHAPAGAKSLEAQAAAVGPANEVTSQAQANQVGEMEQAETPAFDKAAFKAKLMQRIQDVAPKNLKEADDFKSNNKLAGVKGDMANEVEAEKTASQQPLDEKTKQAPDTTGIEPKPVTPLPSVEESQPPADVGAAQAVPKTKGPSEVETPFEEGSQSLDQQMAEEDLTDQQLKESGEPDFVAAAGAKEEAQIDAAAAPVACRQTEQSQISQAQGEAVETAQQQMQGMQDDRAQGLAQVLGQQEAAKGEDEKARAKVAGDIQTIYDTTKGKVEKILGDLDGKVNSLFDSGAAQAQKDFASYVDQRMSAYKRRRYSGVRGKGRWIRDRFLDLPSEVNVFYETGRKLYIKQMDGVINQVVNLIEGELTKAKTEVANGRQKVQDYVAKLPEDLQTVGQEAADSIQSEFDSLEQSVDNKQDDLIDSLAQKYQKNLQAIDADIEKRKEANKGLVSKAAGAIKGVINTIKQLKKMLMSVLKGAAAAIKSIIKDPIGFLSKLINGIKQGFDGFVGNILKHLQGGLVGWLTGAMGGMGIQIPKDIFSLPGIFDLVMQILGLSWNYIRGKAVKLMGEPVVAAAEKASDIFLLLKEKGVLGLWEVVKDQFNDLKETIMDQIKDMVIVQVIQAGVKWIMGLLNPASAFVKACMLIYDVVMFFVRQGSQIISLVKAVIDGVKAIASGSVGAVAKAIEGALVKSLPVVIGFLASIAGVGGIAGKVQAIVKKIRSRIDKAIDKLLAKVKGLFKGKKGKTSKINKDAETDKSLNLKSKVKKELDKEIPTEIEDEKSLKAPINSIYSRYKKDGLKSIKVDKRGRNGELNIKVSASPETTQKVVKAKPSRLSIKELDIVRERNRRSASVLTFLFAKFNGNPLGRFDNKGKSRFHAEKNLVNFLKHNWSTISSKEGNDHLQVDINRSPCGESSADCSQLLYDFCQDYKIKLTIRAMSLYKGQSCKHAQGSKECLEKLVENPNILIKALTLEDLREYGIDPDSLPDSLKAKINARVKEFRDFLELLDSIKVD